MTETYDTPSVQLTLTRTDSQVGSLEKGISGDYQLTIEDALKESWSKTHGCKGTIWLATLFWILASLAIGLVARLMGVALELLGLPESLSGVISEVAGLVAATPVWAGYLMIGVRRAADLQVRASSVFDYFPKMINLIITYLLSVLMISVGLILLVLPGIYLAVSYWLAIPLVADKNLSPWRALEASRKAITKKWFTVFVLTLMIGIIVAASAIPLGIGLIWTVPWSLVATGVLYRNVFGVEQSTPTAAAPVSRTARPLDER